MDMTTENLEGPCIMSTDPPKPGSAAYHREYRARKKRCGRILVSTNRKQVIVRLPEDLAARERLAVRFNGVGGISAYLAAILQEEAAKIEA